ncbi:MAG: CorA family divalent cation transporter [Cyclobacteriaceae bacterium]|jgi:magnesium transporter
MKCTSVSIENGQYVTKEISSMPTIDSLAKQKVFWIHLHSDNQSHLVKFLAPLQLNPYINHLLVSGEEIDRIQLYGSQMIVTLQVCRRMEYLEKIDMTCILFDNLLITIDPTDILTTKEIAEDMEIQQESSDLDPSRRVILVILNKMIDMDYSLARNLSKSIDMYTKELMSESISVEITEIEKLKSEVSLLDEILDQTYASVALLPVHLANSKIKPIMVEKLEILEKSIEHLISVVERSDDKLDNIYSRYLYDLQNKTNKRINTLTIVQAIFVPLTFLAGIYGMNFTNMPELKEPEGYFIALGAMFLIAGIELLLFVRKGWFK